MSMHKRKKPILPEQEFPEKKCVLIGIIIGVSLGLQSDLAEYRYRTTFAIHQAIPLYEHYLTK